MDNLYILAVLFLVRGCDGQVTGISGPQNQAVLVSETSAEFTCTVTQNEQFDTYVAWEECITENDGSCLRVFFDSTYQYEAQGGDAIWGQRYGINNPSTGRYDFTIDPLTLNEDSGKYRCISINNPDFVITAELILLQSHPVCSNNATNHQALAGDYVRYVCEITYRGRWAPRITWEQNGFPFQEVQDESSGNTVRFSLTVQVTPDHNGYVYRSTTFFNPPSNLGDEEATNTPSYNNRTTFPPLTVFYPPDQITIAWDTGCLTVGDLVTCNAIGNPEPMYIWRDLNSTDEIIATEPQLRITEEMLGYGWYECEAFNDHGSVTETATFQVCTTTTSAVTTAQLTTTVLTTVATTPFPLDPTEGESGSGPEALSAGAIGGICAAAVVLLVIIIVILIFCIRKKNLNKQKQANETRPNLVAGPDVIRNPDPITNKAMMPDPYDSKAPYPDDKVGHSPSPYNDPYHSQGPYDVEVPPYDSTDSISGQKRNVENLTYADLALEDIPRSRKPIQVLDPTEYAEIRMV